MARTSLVVALALAACGPATAPRSSTVGPTAPAAEPEPEAAEATPSDEPAADVEAPPASGYRRIEQAVHVATYLDGELDECTDVVATYYVPAALTDWTPPEPPPPPPGDRRVLDRACASEHEDLPMLASCTVLSAGDDPEGVHMELRIRSELYRFATTFESDAHERACREEHGVWDAVSETSDEYRRARRDARRRGD